MPIHFASPLYLLLLLTLPVVVLLGRRSLAGLDPIRRRLALFLRLVVVTALVLALAEVQWRDRTERVEVVFLVDHSRSIPEERAELVRELLNAAQGRMDAQLDLGKVVVFGREAATERRLGPNRPTVDSFSSVVARDHTNLEEAVRRGLEALEPDARGRLVLVSDGNATAGELEDALARARAEQVPVDVVPLEYRYEAEALVEKLVVPNEADLNEPFNARVVLRSVAEMPAWVTLYRDGTALERRRVVLQPGANVEEFQLDLDTPGFFRVYAVVEPEEGEVDHLYQNNTAHGFVFARGEAEVLYVHDALDPGAAEGSHLLRALAREQIRVEVVSGERFPLSTLELQAYDAIILDDVSRASFSERQEAAIEEAVGQMGVGLIMIGGERSFGPGEWRGSPVEAALPVEMDIRQEEVIPDGALVEIIHSCEFPEGNAMAVKVCMESVEGLSSKDSVGVLVYGASGNQWVVPVQEAQDKRAIKDRIRNMEIGDMPDFNGIFAMALTSLRQTQASVKHMIIMSDGDPSPPSAQLLRQCRDNRITVSTICYFAHGGSQGPHVQTMRRIAHMTGGKFYYLERADQLPRIFTKESQRVTRSLIVNQTFVPFVRTDSPVIAGLADSLPEVTGYVLTEPKELASVPLLSPEGAPVLAHWQYGLGKSLAFTSDAKPRWAASWVAWDGFSAFWSQAVRWVSKDVEESALTVRSSIRGDRGVIAVDAVSPDGELLTDLELRATVTPPDGDSEPVEVVLRQRGSGRYEGEFPVGDAGTYNVHIVSRENGQVRHATTTGLVASYPEEFQELSSNAPLLEEVARSSGGRVIAPQALLAGDVDLWDREALPEKIALEARWPWLLALALGLFFLDVALRRVAIDWDKLWARAKATLRRSEAAPAATMAQLAKRKQTVREETVAKHDPVDVPRGPTKTFQAPEGATEAEPVDVGGVSPTPKAPKAPKPGAPKGDEGGSTYSRLLEAKRRAQRERDAEDPS